MTADGPLSGIRVVEVATFIAAPFCGTILADFGAEVIKVEEPKKGDPLRSFGTPSASGDTYAWLSEGRNKKSITLDLRTPSGAKLFRDLVATSHIVLENFRPGTLESWGLGYEDLKQINPALVMLRISAYGQTGPMSQMPGFARVAHAFSGLSHLAGMPDGPPVVPGSTSLADYCSGMWGAIGVMMALRHAEKTGQGQYIDIGLYESIFRLLDELVPVYDKTGIVRQRMGADVPHVVPHGHWQTSDGRWIALACSSDKIFARFARLIGRKDLVEKFATGPTRIANRHIVNEAITQWAATLTADEAVRACNDAGVPCGEIMDIAQIFENHQYRSRNNIEDFSDKKLGSVKIPNGMPKLSITPPVTRWLGPDLGQHTNEILEDILGLTENEIERLRNKNIL